MPNQITSYLPVRYTPTKKKRKQPPRPKKKTGRKITLKRR